MPKKLGKIFNIDGRFIEELCNKKNLADYEKEIIIRIYIKKQSINYISDTMEFDNYGKNQKYYSSRSINNFHREAVLKLVRS